MKQDSEENASSNYRPTLIAASLDRNIKHKASVTIKVSSILKYLVITAIILLLLNILVIICFQMGVKSRVTFWFYFDREMNFPTYFSLLLILMASVILNLIAALKRKEKDSYAKHWIILAFIFLLLSIDESVGIHELLIEPLRNKFQLTGFLRFPWVIAGGFVVLLFSISFLRFFLALPKPMKMLFFISGATYVVGAIGMEMIGGYFFISFDDVSQRSLPYLIVVTVEETLEMCGILLFIYTLLLYLKAYTPKINLNIE